MKPIKRAIKCDTDNSFTTSLFNNMCEQLEKGERIWLYCWCIGHTRCAMVEASYLKELEKKYGDRFRTVPYEERHENDWFECYELK